MLTAATTTELRPTSAAERLVYTLEELHRYYEQRGLQGEELTPAAIHFAAALARYRFACPSGMLLAQRAQVMVFGGAGSGKSSTANILLGRNMAEVNAQAGYTRHPVAFFNAIDESPSLLWPAQLGSLVRYDRPEHANIDQNRFDWRGIDAAGDDFLDRHVVWDCPDLTAKDASFYQSRVVEIAALADVAIYVASDERYNDELPTNFLQAMLEAGKPVVVVLTKVAAEDADQLIGLFRRQVVERLRHAAGIVDVIAIPSPRRGGVAALWGKGSEHIDKLRAAVRDAIARHSQTAAGELSRFRIAGRLAAAQFFRDQMGRLLDPLRRDLAEWRAWMELVRKTANDAVLRYERDYLNDVHFQEFHEVLAQLRVSLALPGNFEYLWQGLELLRTPWRLLRGSWRRFSPGAVDEPVDEERAINRVRRAMIEGLQVACAQRRGRHRYWEELHQALQGEAHALIEPAYHQTRDRQRRDLQQQIGLATQKISDAIEGRPVLLGGLRIARTTLDGAAVVGAFYFAGFNLLAVLLVPLGVGMIEESVELITRKYVDQYRYGLIRLQKEQIRELIQKAYIDSLLRIPRSRGGRLTALSELEEHLPRTLASVESQTRREAEA